MDFDPLPRAAAIALFAVLGLLIGSFLNVVVYRLPKIIEREWWEDAADLLAHAHGEAAPPRLALDVPAATVEAGRHLAARIGQMAPLGLAQPRSACPVCSRPIRWYENVPIASWLALKRRCAGCSAPISPRYPAVEAATALLFAAVAWRCGWHPVAFAWAGFVSVLLALALIDWDTTLLPDSLTQPLLWAGLLVSAIGWTLPLATAVIGAAAGYLVLWAVYWLFKLATGKEGMGQGDFKLLAALGAWLGWEAILPVLLMSSVIGAAVGIGMKFSGSLREGRYVPFGPFLAGAGLVVALAGTAPLLALIGWR